MAGFFIGSVIGYGYGYDEAITIPGIIVPLNTAFIQGVDVINTMGQSASNSLTINYTGTEMSSLYMGGIAGALYKGSISGSQSNVTLNANIAESINTRNQGGNIAVGGIAGYTSSTEAPQFCLFNNFFHGDINVIDESTVSLTILKGGIAGRVLNDDVVNNVAIGAGWTDKFGLLSNAEGYFPSDTETDTYNFSYANISDMSDSDFEYLTSKTAPADPSASLEGAGGLWLSAYLTMGHADPEVGLGNMDNAFATQRMLEKNDDQLSFSWWLLGTATAPASAIQSGELYADVLTPSTHSLVLIFTGAIDDANSGWEISPDGINGWTNLPTTADIEHNNKYIRYKVAYKHNESMGVNKVSYSNPVQIAVEFSTSSGLSTTGESSSEIFSHSGVIGIDAKENMIQDVRVYNIQGQLVYEKTGINANACFTPQLQQGIYLVRVKTDIGVEVKKIECR